VPGWPGIRRHALFDVLGFADIKHVPLRIDHAVDARSRGSHLREPQDRSAPGCKRTGGHAFKLDFRQGRFLVFLAKFACRIDVFIDAVHGYKIMRE
jgi:hypothetical protein